MNKTIYILSYNDTNDLKNNLAEQNTHHYTFKVLDISQKIGFFTRIGILLSLCFSTVVFVINNQFFVDGDSVYLAKLALKSKKSLFLTFELDLACPTWLSSEKINYLSVPITAKDIREGFHAISKLSNRGLVGGNFFN